MDPRRHRRLSAQRWGAPDAGLRARDGGWLLTLGIAVGAAFVVTGVVRTVGAPTAVGPLLSVVPAEAWGLLVGMVVVLALDAAGHPLPRPAPAIERLLWLPAAIAVGMGADLGALAGAAGPVAITSVVSGGVIVAVTWTALVLQTPARIALLVTAGLVAGPVAAVALGAIAPRPTRPGMVDGTGRELALLLPILVVVPVAVTVLLAPVVGLASLDATAGGALAGLVLPADAAALLSSGGTMLDPIAMGSSLGVMAALAVPLVLALGVGAHASRDHDRARSARTRAIVPVVVLLGATLIQTVAGSDGPLAPPSAAAIAELGLVVTFAAVGLRAPVRTLGPWSPRVALLVALGACWLVVLGAIGAMAMASIRID